MENQGEIIIYESKDGLTKIDVKMVDETVWLTQAQLAELYTTTPQNITIHIKDIYNEHELEESATCKDFLQVQKEGNRNVERNRKFYNLDMILSLGYRIKSQIATRFRQWSTERLKEYMIKGFTMDDDRLKQLGGGNYWKELLNRIKDIRSSEKVMYRQVLDLYATSVDYNPTSTESITFFKIVQNKLHFATHGNTAAEVIYNRADAEKEFMGLTSFDGEMPTLKDVVIAKNYLTEVELKTLNNLVSAYFDLAELKAINKTPMYMQDYITELDKILTATDKGVLIGSGKISHDKAIEKATAEYRKYQNNTLSPVEKAYLDTIKQIKNKVDKN